MTKSVANLAAGTIMLLVVNVLPIAAQKADGDKKVNRGRKLSFRGGFGLSSPCLPEDLNTGAVAVSVAVSANAESPQEKIDVQVRFKGPAQGSLGGAYDVSGTGHLSHNAVKANYSSYRLPATLNVAGAGDTPGFTAFFELNVFVNRDHKPLRLLFGNSRFICDRK
jgi:hypothetical protein